MPRADLTLLLFWASLGLSAAAVFLFLWLMRAKGQARLDDAPHPPPPDVSRAATDPAEASAGEPRHEA